MVKFTPKGTVLQVTLYNKNVNGKYAKGSGLAYITESGSIWLDGHIYPVGGSAYLHNDTYCPEPPEELVKQVNSDMSAHIEMLIEESAKIDRNAIVLERESDLCGITVKHKDTSIRYRNLSGQDFNQRDVGGKIDAITTRHNSEAIRKAITGRELDKYRFEVGGILHLANEAEELTPIQKQAILNYEARGGRLGMTALDALDRTEEIKILLED
jgi:hypothetical protein